MKAAGATIRDKAQSSPAVGGESKGSQRRQVFPGLSRYPSVGADISAVSSGGADYASALAALLSLDRITLECHFPKLAAQKGLYVHKENSLAASCDRKLVLKGERDLRLAYIWLCFTTTLLAFGFEHCPQLF